MTRKRTNSTNSATSTNSLNPISNPIHNSNRRKSNASDPGEVHSNMVVGTRNWRTNRNTNKNTTLKNIQNRVKAANKNAITKLLNTPQRSPALPQINTPKMASRNLPYVIRKPINLYKAAKYRWQTRKHAKAGMNLLTEEQNPRNLHPNYYKFNANANANLNALPPMSNNPGSSFVRAH